MSPSAGWANGCANLRLPSTRREELKLPGIRCSIGFRPVELLLNVVKHAGSKKAWIAAAGEDGVLSSIVEDRGWGLITLSSQKTRRDVVQVWPIQYSPNVAVGDYGTPRPEARRREPKAAGAADRAAFGASDWDLIVPLPLPHVTRARPAPVVTSPFPIGSWWRMSRAMVRQGLCLMLDACPDIAVIAEALPMGGALELARDWKPSVVVIDHQCAADVRDQAVRRYEPPSDTSRH